MPSIKDESTVEAIARAFCGPCKRNEEQAMLAVGYSKTYARGGRGHEMVYGNERIKAAIARIDAKAAEKMEYSMETYRQELEEARKHARELRQPSAEVSAIVAKGRSCGFDKDNNMIVCQHEDDGSKDTKFTVIFEGDEIEMLQRMVDRSEGKMNFEQALYDLICSAC
ncbi:hypothetical protein LCGC14_2703460 [marine sediment metagenome]|uniref:Uncharacterized protein n=1 Tax=marine sediment metagenome TaxID=412755 RepID=A0A0F9A2P8_9ZZZZ